MIENGFCECGCGQMTTISKWSNKNEGYTKGKPRRFIRGHFLKLFKHPTGKDHPNYKGGINNGGRYLKVQCPDHPRANRYGYVFQHILIAEKILGKPLPPNVEIHHFPGSKQFTHLVICEDHKYHCFLHQRYRALKGCGHPDWRKCSFCKQYDDPQNLRIIDRRVYHLVCRHVTLGQQKKGHRSLVAPRRPLKFLRLPRLA